MEETTEPNVTGDIITLPGATRERVLVGETGDGVMVGTTGSARGLSTETNRGSSIGS